MSGPDGSNDRVVIYKDEAQEWRWRREDTGNGKVVSESSEGYENRQYLFEAACEYNPGVPIFQLMDDPVPGTDDTPNYMPCFRPEESE